MNSEILVAVLSAVGTVVGSGLGVIASSRLTQYRFQQLEKKVGEHNNLIARMYAVEKTEAILTEEIKVANHRIEDLEQFHK